MRTVTPPTHRLLQPAPATRPRVGPDLLAALPGILTSRDRWLIAMLHEHQVLTTTQITRLAFGTGQAASRRLAALYRWRIVDWFRPYAAVGSAPRHYVLDEAGAQTLAAEHALTPQRLGYIRRDSLAIAHAPHLAHTIGLHDVLTRLADAASRIDGAKLDTWWSERRATRIWGDWIRPDAYARYTAAGRSIEFFLEYDHGTETLQRLASKLPGYARLAQDTGIDTPVLFWLPGPQRETHLLNLLRDADIPAATTCPHHADHHPDGPAGPVWAHPHSHSRMRLTDLPGSMATFRTVAVDLDRTATLPAPPPHPPTARPSADTTTRSAA